MEGEGRYVHSALAERVWAAPPAALPVMRRNRRGSCARETHGDGQPDVRAFHKEICIESGIALADCFNYFLYWIGDLNNFRSPMRALLCDSQYRRFQMRASAG